MGKDFSEGLFALIRSVKLPFSSDSYYLHHPPFLALNKQVGGASKSGYASIVFRWPQCYENFNAVERWDKIYPDQVVECVLFFTLEDNNSKQHILSITFFFSLGPVTTKRPFAHLQIFLSKLPFFNNLSVLDIKCKQFLPISASQVSFPCFVCAAP